jgi:hypothetical protein
MDLLARFEIIGGLGSQFLKQMVHQIQQLRM